MLRTGLKIITLALGLYLAGFAVYFFTLPAAGSALRPAEVSKLAVFTGGSKRIGYGVQLAAQTPHTPLLITGIHPSVSNNTLAQRYGLVLGASPAVTLDRTATTTRENIAVLQNWSADSSATIGVITAHYHAPRVRALLQQVAPQLAPSVLILPVVPDHVPLHFYVREYTKLLFAAAGLV